MYKKQILEIIRNNNYFNNNSSISIKNLGMGENNLNYLVINDGNKYVFRISTKKHHEKNACKEFKFLKFLPKDVAPRPIFMDISKKYIPYYYSILSYVEGKSVLKWNKDKLKSHALTMAKLHSKTFNYWQTTGKKRKKFSLYQKMTKDMKSYKEVLNNTKLKPLIDSFKKYIEYNDYYFLKLKKFHFIHGDLCADNILFNGKNIRYIDWEWCGIRDNAEDIARVYLKNQSIAPWYINLKEEEIEYLLKQYIKNSKYIDNTLKQRVEIWNNYVLFTDMLYFFWKINNYNSSLSKLPKKKYIEASRKLFKYFSRQGFN